MFLKKTLNLTDKISIWIVIISIAFIFFVFWKSPPESIYNGIGLIGSIASTGGLIIAVIQIMELRKTAEATQSAISTTEKELSILRAIESASNCFNQLNQIDEYLETNNFDSIKTILPIATKNFHEMVLFKDFDLEKIMEEQEQMGFFLESFAGKLTILTNHKNIKKSNFQLTDKELEDVSLHLQKVKAFTNKYKNKLQQAIVKS